MSWIPYVTTRTVGDVLRGPDLAMPATRALRGLYLRDSAAAYKTAILSWNGYRQDEIHTVQETLQRVGFKPGVRDPLVLSRVRPVDVEEQLASGGLIRPIQPR